MDSIAALRYRRRPAPWTQYRWRILEKPPFGEFILLSIMLHTLCITLFGAPAGGSREGRAMWGSMDVVLRGPAREAAPMLKLDRGTSTLLPRIVPAERAAPRPPAPAPPAATPAPPSPVDLTPAKELERRPVPEAIVPPAPVETVPPPMPPAQPAPAPAPIVVPRLLDRLPSSERNLEMPPPLQIPQPTEAPFIPPLLDRIIERKLEMPAPLQLPTPPVERAPVETLAVPIPPLTPQVERKPLEVPVVPIPPVAPQVERKPVEAPAIPIPPTAPPVERAPVETPAIPIPPLTPQVERKLLEVPVVRPPVELPSLPTPPSSVTAPPKSEPATRPSVTQEVPLAPKSPAIDRPDARVPERGPPTTLERDPAIRIDPPGRTSPFSQPAPSGDFLRKRTDDPSTGYDPTKPELDLDEVRRRAGQLAREGVGRRAILPFPMPPEPERKTKEQIAIEKARKPDCKTAYQGLGLLAVVPLLANEFGEGNCRW